MYGCSFFCGRWRGFYAGGEQWSAAASSSFCEAIRHGFYYGRGEERRAPLSRFGGVEKHKVNRVVNVSPHFALSLSLSLSLRVDMVADRYLYGETTRLTSSSPLLCQCKSKDALIFRGDGMTDRVFGGGQNTLARDPRSQGCTHCGGGSCSFD